MSQGSIGQFFDGLTSDYSSSIERCFPRYREMLWALLTYLPQDRTYQRILDLGSGTGNLTTAVAEAFPQAAIECVDLSSESLDECRRRLGTERELKLHVGDMSKIDFPPQQFDLVVSSIAIHHLTSAQKQELFSRVRGWLKPGGVFSFCDQCRGQTEAIYQVHTEQWKQLALEAGSTPEEFAMWMQHQRDHDHHDPLSDQINWLKAAGFEEVDCTWRFLLWSVVQGRA